ncbi:MAG TPA: adenosylcobinamide-GDP ribazoletransferase [Actinomycetota bacterium]|nr:adenosylcobinamide-GDP ribazoletransferase [Actinomycetota bacterium]
MSVEPGRRAHGFIAGISFLTRIPVGGDVAERDIAASVAWFPLVGALVGVLSGAVYLLASKAWSPLVSSLLAIGASIAITGAFHEDGLGDTADAFGAASTGRDPQPVLKDPRMGTFGVVALVLTIGLRVALVASLTARAGALALIAAHALARGVSAATVVSAASAGGGLGSSYAALAPKWRGVVAVVVGLVIATVCIGIAAPAALAVAAIMALLEVRWADRTLGGVSGDVLGTIEQVGELITLLAAVAFAAHVAGSPSL